MTTWTAKHEDQLRSLFGGEFKGRMGAKSWMGPMLEHAQTAALHPIDRSREYMPVAPVSHEAQRANMDISEDALRAVREERHVRETLRRLDRPTIQVLRLAYTPRPRSRPEDAEFEKLTGATPALVIELLTIERVAALRAELADENATARRTARRALEGAARWASGVLEQAQAAYAAAEGQESASPGRRAAAAFARALRVA